MELLVEIEFEDERVEEPFQFNPDLPLWFNLKTIPTFPTDLLMRQHVRKKLPQLRKQILGEAASQIEEKGKAKEDAQSSIEILVDSESIFKVIEESVIQLAEKRVTAESKKTAPTQPKKIKSRQIDGSVSCHGNGDQAPISISDESSKISKSLKQAKMDVPQQPIKDDKVKTNKLKVDHDVAMEISEGKDVEEGEKTEGISSKEEPTDETVDEMMQGLVEEPKIKLPIAPDGYIPNSVIRKIVQPPPPPPPPSSPKEWKLKDVPEGRVHFVEGDQSDVEYEDHEPYTWASSEESSRHEVTPVTSPSPPTEQALYQPFKSRFRTDGETEETIEGSKNKRRLSLKVVGKLVLSHPGFSEERGKTVSAKKTKRTGRGINKEAGSHKKYKRRGTLAGISQDEEEIEEAEEDESEKDPLDLLLQKISDNYWYPKGLKMDVYTTVKTLLSLLEESSSDRYKSICDLLLELNGLVNFGGPMLDFLVRRYVRDLKSSSNERRLSAIHTLKGLGDNRPAVILGILNAMADNESSIQKEAAEALANLAGISSKNAMEDYLANIGIMQTQTTDPLDDLARRFRREARQGETQLHSAATHFLERSQSSQSHLPSSYSPERVKDWLRTYLGNKDLYQYKPKGLKIHAPIHKKKRRMSLTHRVHRPTATGEKIALAEEEELSDEALSGYGSEEGDEEEDEEKDEEKDESMEDEWEEKLVEMESFARHPEEEHLSRPVKLNKHQAMMKAKEMTAEREKAIMEKKAKEKMRKHMEEYEEAMKKKRRKLKHLLPYDAQYYKYYSKPENVKPENVGGKVYQGARRDIKAILKSQSSVQRTETTTSIVAERSSHDSQISVVAQEEASYQSVVSETEQTSFQTSLRQMVHLPIEEEEEEATTPEQSLRKPVIQPISRENSKKEIEKRSFGKGIHFYRDRRRLEDDEMIAKGWGAPFRPRFNTPVEPTGDSGLGESLLTGTGTGTSDTFSEYVIGTKTSGSSGIQSRQEESSRPKSNLTMANVRRHELLSAHKDDRDSQIVPKENWRDFFHLPMIEDKRRHHELLQELQRGNSRVYEKRPKKPTKIKYVPSGIPLTPGISNQRVLHDITVGSKGKGQGIGGRGDILEGPSLGKQGITGYGALQMTWSNMVPRYSAQQRQEGHCVTMGTGKHDLSLGASEKKREEWKKYDADKKIWLRTQMLYPSLFALQEIDFIKRRLSEPRPNKKGNLFQWKTPLPMVSFEPTEKETEKPKKPCRLCDQEDRHKLGPSLPSIFQSENGEDIPIVPRNSIASTCDPWTLPRIKIHKKHAMDGAISGQQPLKEISTES